ncbi:MAG: DUF2784 family protein, partial [Candidatus Omnitrophica bacterium]|nr:DUF2784 family protein [Candidatus Omnitrophota bacterium]
WILFMLAGFMLTLCGFFWKRFFERWLFRIIHLCGIIYVAFLAVFRQYCPLTILENSLRLKCKTGVKYPGSFIAYYIEKLVYPDVNAAIILIPTLFIAVFTVIIFIIRPPAKKKKV